MPLITIPSILNLLDLRWLQTESEVFVHIIDLLEEGLAGAFISSAVEHCPISHDTSSSLGRVFRLFYIRKIINLSIIY